MLRLSTAAQGRDVHVAGQVGIAHHRIAVGTATSFRGRPATFSARLKTGFGYMLRHALTLKLLAYHFPLCEAGEAFVTCRLSIFRKMKRLRTN